MIMVVHTIIQEINFTTVKNVDSKTTLSETFLVNAVGNKIPKRFCIFRKHFGSLFTVYMLKLQYILCSFLFFTPVKNT